MYTVHVKNEIATIRIFENEGSYKNRSIPSFSCTIHFISDSEAYLCNAVGSMKGTTGFRLVAQHLAKQGITELVYERGEELRKFDITRYNTKEQK